MGKLGTRNASCTKQQNIFYRAAIGSAILDLQANLHIFNMNEGRNTCDALKRRRKNIDKSWQPFYNIYHNEEGVRDGEKYRYCEKGR